MGRFYYVGSSRSSNVDAVDRRITPPLLSFSLVVRRCLQYQTSSRNSRNRNWNSNIELALLRFDLTESQSRAKFRFDSLIMRGGGGGGIGHRDIHSLLVPKTESPEVDVSYTLLKEQDQG